MAFLWNIKEKEKQRRKMDILESYFKKTPRD